MKPVAMLTKLARRPVMVVLSGLLLATAGLVLAGPAEAASNDPFVTGYVWSNLTNPSGCFTPTALYSYNSRKQVNTICRIDVGSYQVHFPGLQSAGGNVQVTAYGAVRANCKVGYWYNTSTDEVVQVFCYSFAGARQDNLFVASYAAGVDGSAGIYDFLWADQPTAASYTPSTVYSEDNNTSRGPGTVTRNGVGSYTVRFPVYSGPVAAGSVKVTAYGYSTGVCKVASWGPSGGDEAVNVLCFDSSGASSDELFSVVFASGMNLIGDNTMADAYAWADQPFTASYTPALSYQRDTTVDRSGTITISRAGTGSYDVVMPQQNAGLDGGHVQVTAYGYDTNRCQVVRWTNTSTGRTARINCYSNGGTLTDSLFDVVYVAQAQ